MHKQRFIKEEAVSRSAKYFSERLNQCLDETGVPINVRERAQVLSKMLDIPKQQAWNMLEGYQIPDQYLLNLIAKEFEVDTDWFISENKKG